MLKKHIAIWIQVSSSIKKELDCEPTYIKNFLKSKIRSYEDEATDLHSRKRSEIGSNYICWSVVLIDKRIKAIINECFQKNVNTWKIKNVIRYNADDLNFFLMSKSKWVRF